MTCIGFLTVRGGGEEGVQWARARARASCNNHKKKKQQKNYNQNDAYAFKVLSLMLGQTSFLFPFPPPLFIIFSFLYFTCHVGERFIFIVCVGQSVRAFVCPFDRAD